MATVAKVRKPVNVSRSVKVLARFNGEGQEAEIEISQTKGRKTEVTRYWIDAIPSDFGTAFLVEKQGDGADLNETYDVLFDGQNKTCTCPGNTYHGHCRHVEALAALLAAKKL